jgi:alanine dehydrogenase
MLVGVPREVKNHEYRVAITPAGVLELVHHGHEVLVEAGAGDGSSLPDQDYVAAGAKIVPTPAEVWAADLVLKVKEPMPAEYGRLRPARWSTPGSPPSPTRPSAVSTVRCRCSRR